MERDIRSLAGLVKDPKLQDRLIRSLEALRNFSTQLKILSAIKAAGGQKDKGEQLTSISISFGYLLGDTLAAVTEAKLRQKRNP